MPRLVTRIRAIARRIGDEPAVALRAAGAALRDESRFRRSNLSADDWNGSHDAIRNQLRENLIVRGPSGTIGWRNRTIDILAARAVSSIDHRSATGDLLELASALRPSAANAATFFAFARATRGAGLFEASLAFTHLAYARLEHDADSPRATLRDRLRAIQVAIHRQDLGSAARQWDAVRHSKRPDGPTGELFGALRRYMAIWEGDRETLSEISGRTVWGSALAHQSVLIVGPGPRPDGESAPDDYDVVAHVLRGGSLARPHVDSGYRREIVYSAMGLYEALEAFSDEELKQRYGHLFYFVAKLSNRRLSSVLSNVRVSNDSLRTLYLSGHPNMIPLICLDVLEADGVVPHIVGTNFYASREPYAAGPIDDLSRYYVTNSLASHNPLENRALVVNLANAGIVTGDLTLREVVALSDLEYMRVLDEHYGEPQR